MPNIRLLIDGPVLVLSGKARIRKSAADAQHFLDRRGDAAAPKPKTLSPRIAALIRGEPLAALPKVEAIAPEPPPQPPKLSSPVTAEATVKPKRKVATKPPAPKAEKKKAATRSSGKSVKKPKKK